MTDMFPVPGAGRTQPPPLAVPAVADALHLAGQLEVLQVAEHLR